MPLLSQLVVPVLLILTIAPAAARAATVRITVHVPADTPADATVYLAGSLPEVGRWKADGVKLRPRDDGLFVVELDLPAGSTLEFKFTLGDWAGAEKNADGSERPNRSITINADAQQFDFTVERWATGQAVVRTVVGELRLHEIDSKPLGSRRTIRVWLPPGYDTTPAARFPVLYLHDGQNLFDRSTAAFGREWEVDESLSKLISEKSIRPMIVVGIDNGGGRRIAEYTLARDPLLGGGDGDRHMKFLLDEVRPFVESTYRIEASRANTFIGGSSLGAVISLEIARRSPETFGGVIAMSPAAWWANEALIRELDADVGGIVGAKVWIDAGTQERVADPQDEKAAGRNLDFVRSAERLAAALTKHGVESKLFIDDEHTAHNEPAWAARFPAAIRFICPD